MVAGKLKLNGPAACDDDGTAAAAAAIADVGAAAQADLKSACVNLSCAFEYDVDGCGGGG